MRCLRVPLGFGFVALVVAACSGAEPSDLFAATSGTSSSSTSSSSSGSEATSSSSTSTSSSTSSGSSSGGIDAGADATAPALRDEGNVLCGKTGGADVYCAKGTICCARGKTQGGMVRYDTFECVASQSQCGGQFDAALACDDKDDCGRNEFCCAERAGFLPPATRYVRTSCQANGCANASARMCQTGKTGECSNNTQCRQATDLQGYGVCSQ